MSLVDQAQQMAQGLNGILSYAPRINFNQDSGLLQRGLDYLKTNDDTQKQQEIQKLQEQQTNNKINFLLQQNQNLQNQYNGLANRYDTLNNEYNGVLTRYSQLQPQTYGLAQPQPQSQLQFQPTVTGNSSRKFMNIPSQTGVGRILKYRESGNQGSQMIHYGLANTDGVDVGSYSFITKGDNGGSVGDFIRYAGKKGGIGKQLYDQFYNLTGGNWNNLNDANMWKTKGANAWRALAKSDPKAFEQLEDEFSLRRFNNIISKLRPEVQQAIRNDKTGALMEMAMSTINQHRTAMDILNKNYHSDPKTYIEKVYNDRSAPWRFKDTGDPNMGKKRFNQEILDVLSILNGG